MCPAGRGEPSAGAPESKPTRQQGFCALLAGGRGRKDTALFWLQLNSSEGMLFKRTSATKLFIINILIHEHFDDLSGELIVWNPFNKAFKQMVNGVCQACILLWFEREVIKNGYLTIRLTIRRERADMIFVKSFTQAYFVTSRNLPVKTRKSRHL